MSASKVGVVLVHIPVLKWSLRDASHEATSSAVMSFCVHPSNRVVFPLAGIGVNPAARRSSRLWVKGEAAEDDGRSSVLGVEEGSQVSLADLSSEGPAPASPGPFVLVMVSAVSPK
jgi:hypothetical protein